MPHARRETLISVEIALVGLVVSAVAGYFSNGHRALFVTALAVAALAWTVVQPWGAAAVAAPVLLLPSLPHVHSHPYLIMGILTFVLAVAHWQLGAQAPRLSGHALVAVSLYGVSTLILALAHQNKADIAAGTWAFLVAGILVATCVRASPTGLLMLGFLGAGMGGLAVLESLGVHNYWLDFVHGNHFSQLADYQGEIRARSTIGHPLIAGAVLGAIAMLMIDHPSRWKYLIVPAALGGCVATVSKSSLLALGVAALLLIFQHRHRLSRAGTALAATLVVLYALVVLVPSIHSTYDTRILGHQKKQPVRDNAIRTLRHDISNRPASLLLGDGVGASTRHLYDLGGVRGYFIFDDQYVTIIYDSGVLILFAVVLVGADGLIRADRAARRRGVPALVVLLIVGGFVDSIYWGPYSVLLGLAFGLATQAKATTPNPASANTIPGMSAPVKSSVNPTNSSTTPAT